MYALLKLFNLINFLIHLVLSANVLRSNEDPLKTYSNYLTADDDYPDIYKLYWSFTDKDITFEVHCKTLGWVGLGISPNGGMTDADIALGWVSNGKPYLVDTHATGSSKPKVDAQQNWALLDGYEKDGYTVLKIKRSLDTCDKEHDRPIKKGSMYLIFAWNNQDPTSPEKEDWAYHGSSNRRSKQLIVLNYRTESIEGQTQLPVDTVTYDFRMNNITIPKKDTYYYCDLFELPQINQKMHLVQFEILINKMNKQNFHHLLGFECDEDFVPTGPLGKECGEAGVPEDIGKHCLSRVMFAWAIGGQLVYNYPEVAGYPWVPSNKTRYLLLEFHYDNPDLKTNIVDDSGVRLYITPSLRKHDLGVLLLTNGLLQIPPLSDNIKMSSVCPSECTNSHIPDEGITVMSALLHTHLVGKSVRTYVVRNGQIVKNLVENPSYDFNYQFSIDIEPYKLQKGDSLYTECIYSTKSRSKYTSFGYGTHDEMCDVFLYYYPRILRMPTCASSTNIKSLYNFFTCLMNDGLIPIYNYTGESDEAQKLWTTVLETEKILRDNFTFSSELIKKFNDFINQNHDITHFCRGQYFDKAMDGPFKELNEDSLKCNVPGSFAIIEKLSWSLGLIVALVNFMFHF